MTNGNSNLFLACLAHAVGEEGAEEAATRCHDGLVHGEFLTVNDDDGIAQLAGFAQVV